MKKRLLSSLLMTLTALLGFAMSAPVSAQPVERLSAEFQFSPPLPGPPLAGELMTNLAPAPGGGGGKLVYTKTVFVKSDGTLFVSFWGAGEHFGEPNILMMTCILDGVVCQPGGGFDGASGPKGWIPLLNTNPGRPDNGISYSWCVPVQKGSHTVDLKLASAIPPDAVFYERAHIYIDVVHHGKGTAMCVPAAFVPGSNTLP